MEIQAYKNALKRVLINKIKHSKYTGGGEEEDTHFKDLGFKFSSTKYRINPYLKDLFPSIYYEWSKRKNEEYSGLFLSGMFVRNDTIFKHVNLDFFDTDSRNILKRLNTIDDIFKKFYFENMKFYLIAPHPLNVEGWQNTDLKKFLHDQLEAEINIEIEKFNMESGRRFNLYDGEYVRERNKILSRHLTNLRERNEFLSRQLTDLGGRLYQQGVRIRELEEGRERQRETSTVIYEIRLGNQQGQSSSPSNSINGNEIFKFDSCVICQSEPPNILFCICGHVPFFEECDKKTSNEKCPICRTKNTIKRKI